MDMGNNKYDATEKVADWKNKHSKYIRLSGWMNPAKWQRQSDSFSIVRFIRTISMEEVFAHILTFKAVVDAIDRDIDSVVRRRSNLPIEEKPFLCGDEKIVRKKFVTIQNPQQKQDTGVPETARRIAS